MESFELTAVSTDHFIGNGRAGDIPAQVLKLLALIGAPEHRRIEAKAVRVGAQARRAWLVCARRALQAQSIKIPQ